MDSVRELSFRRCPKYECILVQVMSKLIGYVLCRGLLEGREGGIAKTARCQSMKSTPGLFGRYLEAARLEKGLLDAAQDT